MSTYRRSAISHGLYLQISTSQHCHLILLRTVFIMYKAGTECQWYMNYFILFFYIMNKTLDCSDSYIAQYCVEHTVVHYLCKRSVFRRLLLWYTTRNSPCQVNSRKQLRKAAKGYKLSVYDRQALTNILCCWRARSFRKRGTNERAYNLIWGHSPSTLPASYCWRCHRQMCLVQRAVCHIAAERSMSCNCMLHCWRCMTVDWMTSS